MNTPYIVMMGFIIGVFIASTYQFTIAEFKEWIADWKDSYKRGEL